MLLTNTQSLSEAMHYVAEYIKDKPFVTVLAVMMVIDVVGGILVACDRRVLNSTISYRGMIRKAFMVLLVGMGSALKPYTQEIPIDRFIAGFFILTEAISITENAAAVGLPVPKFLIQMLHKLRDDQQKRIRQKLPHDKVAHVDIPVEPGSTPTTVTVTPGNRNDDATITTEKRPR